VKVQDTTAPALTVPAADITKEATGASGAAVAFAVSATDAVDPSPVVTCKVGATVVSSGDTFPLGSSTVSCTAKDSAGNSSLAQSFKIIVQDTTAPALTVPVNKTVEATKPAGADVSFTASASDLVDGPITPTCVPASGSAFAIGTTTVTCSATDAHSNTGSKSFNVIVQDTTAPVVTVPANIVQTATSVAGATTTFTASATDIVDGSITPTCTPASGSTFAPGTTTVSCSATDAHHNTGTKTFTVTVNFSSFGFLAPVDKPGIAVNIAKNGSTVPLKFYVTNGSGGYISDLAIVKSFTVQTVVCDTGVSTSDDLLTTTGGTMLRYDSTANQFIQNWQTPNKAGSCLRPTLVLTSGQIITADFKLK
jgi:large repetitive protein